MAVRCLSRMGPHFSLNLCLPFHHVAIWWFFILRTWRNQTFFKRSFCHMVVPRIFSLIIGFILIDFFVYLSLNYLFIYLFINLFIIKSRIVQDFRFFFLSNFFMSLLSFSLSQSWIFFFPCFNSDKEIFPSILFFRWHLTVFLSSFLLFQSFLLRPFLFCDAPETFFIFVNFSFILWMLFFFFSFQPLLRHKVFFI